MMGEGKIGIFGLGLIGLALARNLVADGKIVLAYDPNDTRIALMTAFGGRAADPEYIWREAETILIAVFDTTQVTQVLSGAPDKTTAIIAILSTCDPDELALLAQGHLDMRLVDAPISGTSGEVAARNGLFLPSGTEKDVAALEPVLRRLGRGCQRVGDFGAGTRTKLAINLILGLNRAALAEGLVFAEAVGLDPKRFLVVAQDSAAGSAVMATKGMRMITKDFQPEGRIGQSAKDFDLILNKAQATGHDLPLGRGYRTLIQDCIEAGEGHLDNSAIINAVRRSPKGSDSTPSSIFYGWQGR
jgi:3-hydroxyisobutyrate dehydrogenase-like beta-hydroxyacid dehydrogenase